MAFFIAGMNSSSTSSSVEDDESLRVYNRQKWLDQKINCMCDRCRGRIKRARRITLQHITRYKEWDPLVDKAHPHPQMVTASRRDTAKRGRSEAESSAARTHVDDMYDGYSSASPLPHEVVEEEALDDMVRDFFAHHRIEGDQCSENDELFSAASTPLFEGCTFSVLRASLELLNLQTMYGWSNASLNALLR